MQKDFEVVVNINIGVARDDSLSTGMKRRQIGLERLCISCI